MAEVRNVDIATLAQYADKLVEQKALIAALKELLDEAEKEEYDLERIKIPMLMEDLGVSDFSTMDGSRIVLENVVSARIPKNKEQGAHDWLEANGLGDLITRRVVRNVHHGTLGAWVRRKYEQGTGIEIPSEHFDVFVGQKAKVTNG